MKTLLTATLMWLCTTTQANLLVVDSNEDVIQVDGNCTLREALAAANFDISVDQCGTGLGDDLIWLLLGTSGDAIQVTSQLGIIDGVEIQGPGADRLVLFPANGHDGHMLQINTDRNVSFKDFRVGGGRDSAIDVVNVADLLLEDMRLLNNQAATGGSGGALFADHLAIPSRSMDALIIRGSEFKLNQAQTGGALAISGDYPVTIENTLFESNSSTSTGGAIHRHNANRDVFTAVMNISGSQFISNSSNTTGGALSVDFAYLNIDRSLFHDNQGQNVLNINRSITSIENSLFAENPVTRVVYHKNFSNSPVFTELTLAFNTFVDNQNLDLENSSGGANLTSFLLGNVFDNANAAQCQGTGTTSLGGNMERLGASCSAGAGDFPNTDPGLLPLGLYGGSVLLAPPNLTSPAVDAGNGCDAGDLSGEGRPRDGDASGTAQCDLGAVERPNAVNLNVDNVGTGSGQINLHDFALVCYSPDDCDWPIAQGDQVDLTAAADPGSAFIQWGGACSGDTSCQVTMNSAQNVTAQFALVANPVTLTVNKDLAVAGLQAQITSNPAGIDCGNSCVGNYIEGDTVELVATPASGTLVDAWSGCDSVSPDGLICTVNLNTNQVATVFLVADPDLIFGSNFEP